MRRNSCVTPTVAAEGGTSELCALCSDVSPEYANWVPANTLTASQRSRQFVSLIVQKYGGTSVADPERLKRVAGRVADTRAAGNDVIVVVSAMGGSTDDMITLAHQVSDNPPAREMDMLLTAGERISMALLAMALHDLDTPAMSLTGSQAGILTDAAHGEAKITEIRGTRVREGLDAGNVVIVAGFQGVDPRLQGDHDAGPWWLRCHGGRASRGPRCVGVRDLHRCRWCVHRRSTPGGRRSEAVGGLVRGDARAGGRWSGRAHGPVRRVRAQIQHSHSRSLVVQAGRRHVGQGEDHGTGDHQRNCARFVRGKGHRARCAGYAGCGRRIVRADGRSGRQRRHDRAERLPRRHDRHQLHRAEGARRPGGRCGRGARRTAQRRRSGPGCRRWQGVARRWRA